MWSQTEAPHRGSDQEILQPVGMVVKAIEIGEGRRARGLIVAQAGAIGMKVPLQGPRAHGQAGTGLLAVTVTHGVQGPI